MLLWRGRMEGSGEEIRPRQYKYPAVGVVKRPAHACFSLSRPQFVIFGFARQTQIKTPYCGERERLTPKARRKQAVSQILSGRRRAPFAECSYNFGITIFCRLQLWRLCYKMSFDFIIKGLQ